MTHGQEKDGERGNKSVLGGVWWLLEIAIYFTQYRSRATF